MEFYDNNDNVVRELTRNSLIRSRMLNEWHMVVVSLSATKAITSNISDRAELEELIDSANKNIQALINCLSIEESHQKQDIE